MTDAIRLVLKKVIADHAGKPVDEITDQTPLGNEAGGLDIDSLDFINILSEVEQELELSPFSDAVEGKIFESQTVGEMIDIFVAFMPTLPPGFSLGKKTPDGSQGSRKSRWANPLKRGEVRRHHVAGLRRGVTSLVSALVL